MRIWHTVRTYQTIIAEVLVTGIKLIKVATIAINHLAILFPTNRLVNEIPYKATLVLGVFTDDVPILLKTALRVTHCVSIFALNQRFGLRRILTILDSILII